MNSKVTSKEVVDQLYILSTVSLSSYNGKAQLSKEELTKRYGHPTWRIADRLGVKTSVVYRILQKLMKKGIVTRETPYLTKQHKYILNFQVNYALYQNRSN